MSPEALWLRSQPAAVGAVFFAFLFLAITTGAFVVGAARIYLGDIYISGFFALMLYRVATESRPVVLRWMLVGIGLLTLFIVFDLLNRVPSDDLTRGALRNYIFCFVGMATCLALEVYGRRQVALWVMAVLVSFPLFAMVLNPELLDNIDRLFRWENGIFFMLPVQAAFVMMFRSRQLRLAASAAAFLAMGAYSYTMDIRSLSGMLWFAAFGELLCGYKYVPTMLRIPAFVVMVFMLVAASVVVYSEVTSFDYSVYQRRNASDSLREEMAKDAWASYLESPVIGNGSWQHARSFVDPDKMEALIGVHSTILQFAYEYGTLGLLVGLGMLGVQLSALWRLIQVHRVFVTDWIYGYLVLLGIYHTIMSPFAGPQRFTLGISFGIACSVLLKSSRHVWSAGPPRPLRQA